ncbi:MAG TPA: LysR family transcriptional regulator [Caldimonas sp.]
MQGPDLNLLVVFSQLYQDRKVSLAAQNLGLSQPTVSAALARLRTMMNDELFVRTARGMQPTPLAERIAAPLGRSLADIRHTLATQASFDASTATRQFSLAMTDIGEFHFLPRLVAALEAAAPQLSISTVRGTAVNLKFEMEAGRIDLALGFLPDLVNGFHRRVLFTQRYVCLYRCGHPMAERPTDLAIYAACQHAVVVSAGTGHGHAEQVVERCGLNRFVRLRVPHYVALADVLEATDLVATVPEAFALRSVKHFDLAYSAHPIELPPIEIALYWHTKYQRDRANRWMRNLIIRLFQLNVAADNTRSADRD